MADQQQPTVAGSPVQSGTQASVPIRPIDGAQGFLVRALSLAVVLFTLFAWIGGWIPETQVAWVIVIIGSFLIVYLATGVGSAAPDGPRTAAELAFGTLIAFCAAWGLGLVLPAPTTTPLPGPTMVIAVDEARVHLGDGSSQPPAEAVDGRALVVTTTSDAAGVRSRTVVALDVRWRYDGHRYLLTVSRGEGDATAQSATAALAGSEEVWLLPGR